jgi:integrative and conjugative element protein (TIGR02256 family)
MSSEKYIRVIIARSVLNIIESFKQSTKRSSESGGILLGQVRDNDVFILKVTTPNKFDHASRFLFNCNKDAAQVIIDYEFINSGHKTIYLGEWHTHPENYPSPSNIDRRMIDNQYFKNKINEPFLVLLIHGLEGTYSAIFDGNKLLKIELTISEDA